MCRNNSVYICTQTGPSLYPTHHSCAGVVTNLDEAYFSLLEQAKADIDPTHLGLALSWQSR